MSDQPERISLDPDAELVRADFDRPSIARIYDYHLGGSANFAVDREAADAMQQRWPRVRCYARANRAFLTRAVRTLVTDYGFEQFLDLGSGVPTVGNVHEIAHQVSSDARVAYVDWEAIAVHHARRLLNPTETRVSVTQADVSEPEKVLTSPGVAGLLDFTRPVAVLACGILEILPPVDRAQLMARYRAATTSGSALAASHTARLDFTDEEWAGLNEVMAGTSTPYARSVERDDLAELMPGYTLLEPGVVPAPQWRPEHRVPDAEARGANVYAAVGILP
jgi:hypothetical protein